MCRTRTSTAREYRSPCSSYSLAISASETTVFPFQHLLVETSTHDLILEAAAILRKAQPLFREGPAEVGLRHPILGLDLFQGPVNLRVADGDSLAAGGLKLKTLLDQAHQLLPRRWNGGRNGSAHNLSLLLKPDSFFLQLAQENDFVVDDRDDPVQNDRTGLGGMERSHGPQDAPKKDGPSGEAEATDAGKDRGFRHEPTPTGFSSTSGKRLRASRPPPGPAPAGGHPRSAASRRGCAHPA